MSNDHSKDKPAHKWWQVLTPHKEWGIGVGITIGMLALFAPAFLVGPLLSRLFDAFPIDANYANSLYALSAGVLAVLIIAAALVVYKKKFSDLGLHRPTWLHLARAVVALIIYVAASVVLHAVVFSLFGNNLNPDQPQELGFTKPEGWDMVAVFVPLVIVAPFMEEIVFRGFMFKGVRRKLPFWVAAFVVSALFGLVHGQWNVGLDVFAMSMISCYLVEKTGSLWPSIFLHMLKNAMAFSLVYVFSVSS